MLKDENGLVNREIIGNKGDCTSSNCGISRGV